MESIRIFLVVMSCSPDALNCENVSNRVAYSSIPSCRAARAQVLQGAPRAARADRLLLARCQHVLVKGTPTRDAGPAEWRAADHVGW